MLTWIVLGAVAMMSGGWIAYRVGKQRGARAALPPARPSGGGRALERGLKDVRVDDILQHGGRDWLVEALLAYDEDGHKWKAARAVDSPDERWFVIGLDRTGPMTVRVLSAADLKVDGYPPDSLEHGGVSYSLAQRGTATVLPSGALGDVPGLKAVPPGSSTRCRWWRYGAAGEKTLLVEQWGEQYRTLVGETRPGDEVEMLAGS